MERRIKNNDLYRGRRCYVTALNKQCTNSSDDCLNCKYFIDVANKYGYCCHGVATMFDQFGQPRCEACDYRRECCL
jgi:hypothetical protein